ncbi:MAG: hypothetical protein GEU91_22715 [Rhizobiales bacterium]|nr:hypothetical protein [Hyphomicrobiales bacterium]
MRRRQRITTASNMTTTVIRRGRPRKSPHDHHRHHPQPAQSRKGAAPLPTTAPPCVATPKGSPPTASPCIRYEQTGRKAVYVNRLITIKMPDLPDEERAQLLNTVRNHSTRPGFVYEHVWRVGDLLLWDNRRSSTEHGRCSERR